MSGRHAELPDEALVRLVLDGSAADFAHLVRRHQAELYRYARGMRIDHDAASDLVQDAFVTAYTRLERCREPARFRYWIFRILRNRCLDWLKNIRRQSVDLDDVPLSDDGERASPESAAQRLELREALTSALDELGDEMREAFLLKHHEGMSYDEIAAIAGASVSAVKMRVHRAREALRGRLLAAGVTPSTWSSDVTFQPPRSSS